MLEMTIPRTVRFADRAFYTDAPLDVDKVEGIIRGYVYIFGDDAHRDAYGTFFDRIRVVDLGFDIGPVQRPLSWEHLDEETGQMVTERIGELICTWFDDIGLRFEARLDRTLPAFPRFIIAIDAGKVKTSSATAEHTAKFYPDGAFKLWWLVELALTENPAEQRMPQVELVRSAEGVHAEPRADATLPSDTPLTVEITNPERNSTMTIEQLLAMAQEQGISLEDLMAYFAQMQPATELAEVEEVIDAVEEEEGEEEVAAPVAQMSAPAPAQAPRSAPAAQPSFADVMAELVELKRSIQGAPAPRNPQARPATRKSGEGVNVNLIPDEKFGNLSASDMWLVAKVLGDNKVRASRSFMRAMVEKSYDELKDKQDDQYARQFVRSYKANKTTRTDEIMATNIAGQGLEWVGVMYSDVLWGKARVRPIYQALQSRNMYVQEIGQGQNSVYIPTDGADPTWNATNEANDVSSGRIVPISTPTFVGTGRRQVTPGTLRAKVAYSDELEEDSLIPMASWLNTQFQASAAEIIEKSMINGDTDTSASTNINLYDGTPGTGTSRPYYLVTDGFLKLPLITTTSLTYDANNTLDEDTYMDTASLLPDELTDDPDKILFIVDVSTYRATQKLAAVKTRDVNSAATIESGRLTQMWGSDLLVTGQMPLADDNGKISTTGSNNVFGRILAIAPQYWALVWKRQVRFKLTEDADSDSTILRASLRMGVTYRSTNASAVAIEVAV